MRRATNPAITSQMYRHFATVTAALTALVAFTASGEQGNAAAPIHVTKTATKVRDSAVEASERAVSPGSWGSDSDGDFGKPTMSASGSGSWFANPFASAANNQPGDPPISQRLVSEDDPADDSATQPASAPAPTAAQISAAMAASRLRSGATGGD